MARTDEVKDSARLDYAGASERANELREEAEAHLAIAAQLSSRDPDGTPLRPEVVFEGIGALFSALVVAILEVSARLELLELDAELAREEAAE
jgi:hypothetical protein